MLFAGIGVVLDGPLILFEGRVPHFRARNPPYRRYGRKTIRAVGDAGPYGGIDENTPVLGGAPMRAVGDAGPYGCATGDVAEQPAGGTGPRPYGVVQA